MDKQKEQQLEFKQILHGPLEKYADQIKQATEKALENMQGNQREAVSIRQASR
jgi:hypothetical protein